MSIYFVPITSSTGCVPVTNSHNPVPQVQFGIVPMITLLVKVFPVIKKSLPGNRL
jgi:hypothetical protein